MLRLISFNMDYYWSCNAQSEPVSDHWNWMGHWSNWSIARKSSIGDRPLAEKERQTTPHGAETYSFTNYLTYVLYPPLYIGGPIMSFNDFMWQVGQFFENGSICWTIVLVSPTTWHTYVDNSELCPTVCGMPFDNGAHSALYVCRCYQRYKGMGRIYPSSNQHGRILESHHRMAQGDSSSIFQIGKKWTNILQ